MQITPIVINYESKKTPGDVYQHVLKTLDEMICAIDDKQMLCDIKLKAMDVIAVIENRLYKMSQNQPLTDDEKMRLREHEFWKEGI